MQKNVTVLVFLGLILLAFGALASCTRSASTPAATQDPIFVATSAALQTEQAAQRATQTQAARPSATPLPTLTATATPEMVFADPGMTAQNQVDARWVSERDAMRPISFEPLTFGRNLPATWGDMAIAIGRACLDEKVEDPFGTVFTDLRTPPDGVSPEKSHLIEAVSEELVQRDLFLFKEPAKPNLSYAFDAISPDKVREWWDLAKNSPECNQVNANATTGSGQANAVSGSLAKDLPDPQQSVGFFQLLSFSPPQMLGTQNIPTRTHTPAPTNPPPKTRVPTRTPTSAPTNTPRPPGRNPRKHESTNTPRPIIYYTSTPAVCVDGALQGGCGLTRIQLAGLLHESLADWVFPPNQLPTPTPQVP